MGAAVTTPPISMAVIGAGERGTAYASYAHLFPAQAEVVAVAEPRDAYRAKLAQAHRVPSAATFENWQALASRERIADIAIVATPDSEHADAAVALAGKGYDLLLEKPMATSEADCHRIIEAVERSGVRIAVCHVLRFTPYTELVQQTLASGAIGRLISIQHLEPVGYWHYAHSYVRGNWRKEEESTFMLLAKSCHDLDWIRCIVGSPCTAVSSFGSLSYFQASNKPEGAGERCTDCSIEAQCPYSAKRLYGGRIERGLRGWPVSVLSPDPTPTSIDEALREGPYGRCVFSCDNDVVDHQVVNMEFSEGQTASFTMTAFSELGPRRTRIFGTHGEIEGDGHRIKVYRFGTETWSTHEPSALPEEMRGHGGGDFGLMQHFIEGLRSPSESGLLTTPREILESHRMAFAAERARRAGVVVRLD